MFPNIVSIRSLGHFLTSICLDWHNITRLDEAIFQLTEITRLSHKTIPLYENSNCAQKELHHQKKLSKTNFHILIREQVITNIVIRKFILNLLWTPVATRCFWA